MRHHVVALALMLAASVGLPSCAWAQTVSKDPSVAPTGSYRMEPAHSQLLFSIVHFGLTDYYGRFDTLSGTLDFNAAEPDKSTVAIAIDTTSIDTPSARLNDELKGAGVFATDQFPSASFKSDSVVRTGADTGRVTGDLTIKGVTKPVTLDVVFSGGEQNPLKGTYALGFRATATIKRSDFGMTSMMWSPFVSDDVQLIIEAMFEYEKG